MFTMTDPAAVVRTATDEDLRAIVARHGSLFHAVGSAAARELTERRDRVNEDRARARAARMTDEDRAARYVNTSREPYNDPTIGY